jgi:hypothetical protein
MGPSLLFHAQRGALANKRSHELMFTGSCPSTYQQQIRNFNSLTLDVSVPMINTLHGMSSLLHLSSTQSELGNCNVHYSRFDTDRSLLASVDDQINTNDDSVTDPVIEKCTFQRNTICLPPDIAFQVHLLSQMNEHRGNYLNMFNEVIRCIKAHAIHYNMDYTTLQILSRKQLVQLLAKYYQLNLLKPTLHSVPLTDGSVATVPIFDVKTLLIAFLNDPLRMHQENFASNLISLQERQNCQHQILMKYTLDHFGSRLDKNTVVMIHMHFP